MLLRSLRQRNRAMSEVDVFTTSEKQLRDLAASFSRLRSELQFGARLHSGIADLTRRSKEAPAFAAVSAVAPDDTDEARRATGPLHMGSAPTAR
jgi:hypothetical protein